MTASLVALIAALLYLIFCIDWKEFGAVFKEGGWAALAFFALVGVAVAYGPHFFNAAHGGGMGH